MRGVKTEVENSLICSVIRVNAPLASSGVNLPMFAGRSVKIGRFYSECGQQKVKTA